MTAMHSLRVGRPWPLGRGLLPGLGEAPASRRRRGQGASIIMFWNTAPSLASVFLMDLFLPDHQRVITKPFQDNVTVHEEATAPQFPHPSEVHRYSRRGCMLEGLDLQTSTIMRADIPSTPIGASITLARLTRSRCGVVADG